MSKITREALLAMGFEQNHITHEFILWHNDEENHMGVILPMYDYSLCVTQYSGDNVVLKLPHIRTLPQLRQLIRSLFGGDALPRRELSSITDKECRQLHRVIFTMLNPPETGEVERIEGVISLSSVDGRYGYEIITDDNDGSILSIGSCWAGDAEVQRGMAYLSHLDFFIYRLHEPEWL